MPSKKQDKDNISRREYLTRAVAGTTLVSLPFAGNVAAKKADQGTRTIILDTNRFEHVSHGVAKFSESSYNTVRLGGVIDTTEGGDRLSYDINIRNGNVPERAQVYLQRARTKAERQHDQVGNHESGEDTQERDDGSFGTLNHGGKDYGDNFEGGAEILTGLSFERDCVTKQFVRWTSTGDYGSVDWAWRRWCTWDGIDWDTLAGGFADSAFEDDGEYYTKSYGDYSPTFEDDKVFHRVKLWAEPDGEMRWEVVMIVHNAEATENYGHTANVYYSVQDC